jgi:hypothetical protein
MRIEKPNNGLYQAKIAQSQALSAQSQIQIVNSDLIASTGSLNNKITIVSNDLVTATGVLDTKINDNLSKLQIRNASVTSSLFSTTSTSIVDITGTSLVFDKQYTDTQLRINVFINMSRSIGSQQNTPLGTLYVSINSGAWISIASLNASNAQSTYENIPFLLTSIHNGIAAGSVSYKLGIQKALGFTTLWINNFNIQTVEISQEP